jgi:hypothetical protein
LLLESFVRMHHYVPDQAHAITNPEELPNRLRPLTETLHPLSTWRAWMDEPRLWFVIGRLSDEPCQTCDSLLMEILFVSVDGKPIAAGCWGLSEQGRWVLRRVYDPEKSSMTLPPLRSVPRLTVKGCDDAQAVAR